MIKNTKLFYQIDQQTYELKNKEKDINLEFDIYFENSTFKIIIKPIKEFECTDLYIEIEFSESITKWRNYNYKWVNTEQHRIAAEYSPKIFQFSNGQFLQAGETVGAWEYNPKKKNIIHWVLNSLALRPVFYFNPHRCFYTPKFSFNKEIILTLLYTSNSPLEWSRSYYPFTAIFCITDHCDFDNNFLLSKQREFLKIFSVRVTKGFFLHHFSKRSWNSSIENQDDKYELLKWENDGHELIYHSLTQSIRSEENAYLEFSDFSSPKDFNIPKCWIDHGYQPYNFTMQKSEDAQRIWLKQMYSNKNISLFWNYYDSFEESNHINQIAVERFTPSFILRLRCSLIWKLRLLLYYHTPPLVAYNYSLWASVLKSIKKKSSFNISRLMLESIKLSINTFLLFFKWLMNSKKQMNHVRFAPLFFDYPKVEKTLFFQTMAIKNWSKALSTESLKDLIKNSGCCIAHTYLSDMESHHSGRLFQNRKGEVDQKILKLWENFGQMILEKKIWNPTISEWAEFYTKYNKVKFHIDKNGMIIYTGPSEISVRAVEKI